MLITNKDRNVVLAENAILADSIFSRMRGLLGRAKLGAGEALILRPCDSVHTFFMRFPIDVAFVDKNNCLIGLVHSLLPFRLSRIFFKAKFAIELPASTLKATSSQTGDTILIEDDSSLLHH